MANWDSPDLLARFKRLAQRPVTDSSLADSDIYALLTEGEGYWLGQWATHFPWLLWTAPTLLTSADGGVTYTFPGAITPIKVELYSSLQGPLLRPGAYWDGSCDYVWEGNRLRIPSGLPTTFGNGPYARYIVGPGTIDALTASQVTPDWCRILVVHRAIIEWASRGGFRDPTPFENLENKAFYGEPQRGQLGILATLKTQNPFYGAGAWRQPNLDMSWLHRQPGYSI